MGTYIKYLNNFFSYIVYTYTIICLFGLLFILYFMTPFFKFHNIIFIMPIRRLDVYI